jgi:hypothetical protein
LTKGYKALALRLQEGLMHGDVRARLSDSLRDMAAGTGQWMSYMNHDGDGETGDVIYCCDGDMQKAPYVISCIDDGKGNSKAACTIDTSQAIDVVPVTTYQEEADDEDFGSMEESYKRDGLYTELPLYERFISKGERDAADSSDFAGKGKSYPILKPGDVMAAVHAMGRAGSGNDSSAGLKANIIKIAKRKGWTKYLPKAWQAGGTKESEIVPRGTVEPGTLKLVESYAWADADQAEAIRLIESTGQEMTLKLIAPGKGSSAFYPAEVLKRDGPSVFKAGTHIYINHPTQAEEAQRPEGDWHKLAGKLSTNAYWDESAKQGPGLYAKAAFAAHLAPAIKDKASYTGMSIRAAGVAESDKKHDGLPILKQLTSAESVDVVTRAGAGGMILTEAARTAKETEMDATEVQKLVEAAVRKARMPEQARVEAEAVLESVTLPEVAKKKIIREALAASLPEKDGGLDSASFRESVSARAKAEGEYLAVVAPSRIIGMGQTTQAVDPKQIEVRAAEGKAMLDSAVDIGKAFGLSDQAAKKFASRFQEAA